MGRAVQPTFKTLTPRHIDLSWSLVPASHSPGQIAPAGVAVE